MIPHLPPAPPLRYPVVLLAGGLATRMRPLTETIPKSLLTVAGRPFIEHQLALLHRQGARDVIICAGHLGEQIEQVIGDGSDFGLAVRYSWDGPKLLGTGGALRRALPLLPDCFWILYGDSYLPIEMTPIERAFDASGAPALMTVFANGDRWDTSNVIYQDGRIHRYDKKVRTPEMKHIDYGISLLRREVIAAHEPETRFDLAEIFTELSQRSELAGYEVRERFYEIGSPEGLAELDRLLAKQYQTDQR